MFNNYVLTTKELQQLKKMERAKKLDEERKARIFNARQRLIGVDVEALQKQIDEKKLREEAEQKEEEKLLMKEKHNIAVAQALEEEIKKNKKLLLDQINDFRKVYQRKQDRREFDLNDPYNSRKSVPLRTDEDNPPISSFQKFEGEASAKEVNKLKVEQQKAWLMQQINEKRACDAQLKESEKIYLNAMRLRDERAKMLDKLEKEARKQIELANVNFNKVLANELAHEREAKKKMEAESNLKEINNALTSDLLAENPAVSQSNLGSGRKIGSMYKGMSEEEKEEIKKIQAAQRKEIMDRKEEEKTKEKYWVEFSQRMNQNIHVMDLRNARKQEEELKKLYEENERLAQEQKAKKEYMDKIVFTNKPTAEFYNQFNKTTR